MCGRAHGSDVRGHDHAVIGTNNDDHDDCDNYDWRNG